MAKYVTVQMTTGVVVAWVMIMIMMSVLMIIIILFVIMVAYKARICSVLQDGF